MKDNFLKKYFDFAVSVTDAPPVFHEYLALATAGIIIGRGRYIRFGDDYIFPNLWMVILAPTTVFRKSTSLNISRRCVKAVNPALVLPDEFSHEAMLKILSDYPQGVFYYMEFRSMMDLLRREYMSGTKSVLTALYDCPDEYFRKLQDKEIYIRSPFISILSATTTSWFIESIKEGDMEGGFLSRFIFVESGTKFRDDAFPRPADLQQKGNMIESLQNLALQTQQIKEMTLSEPAMKLYCQWYKKFIIEFTNFHQNWASLMARLNIIALKFAIIIESCSSNNLIISEETMKSAIQLVENLIKNTVRICSRELSFSFIERQTKRVLAILQNGEIARSELYRRLSNLKKSVIEDILAKLKEGEEITITRKLSSSGKHAIYYSLKKEEKCIE